ncbi:PREDICTED: mRNA-capping enzyme-like, partial [Nicrophorus vespilloides]
MSRQGKGGPVPNRWMNCPRKASELIIDKFMAFKTPLSADYDELILPQNRFYPQMLFDVCRAKKIKFGIWVDLTNTTRFYNKNIVDQNRCKYIKMQCRGHGETPTQEQTDEFINLVHNFICQHPLECIAVHCTHGFNRTGFLIVSYIVSKLDCSLEIALRMFAEARPPGIYKGDYIKELYRRFADEEDAPPPPEMPAWCFDGEMDSPASFSMLSNNSHSEESSGSSKPQNHKRRGQKEAVFMSGISGVYEFTEQPKAHELKKKVQLMCGWKSKDFPGSQPVSMDTHNIQGLHTKPYRVSWKADGTRYMMLIDGENETYFFDRDYNIFHVDGLTFPYRKDL